MRLALASARTGVWIWRLNDQHNQWSDEVWSLYGLRRGTDAPSLDLWQSSIHPEDRAKATGAVLQAGERGQGFEVEWRTHPANGLVRWLTLRGQPVTLPDTGQAAYVGIVMDITARKQAEHAAQTRNETLERRVHERSVALSQHERLLQSILDGIPGLIGYWTRDLRNRFANKAYMDWCGADPEDIRDRHIEEVIGVDLYQKNKGFIEAALNGHPQRFERAIPVHRNASNTHHCEVHYLPDVADGVVAGFLVIIFNISQIKQAELAAEAANQAKSEFLANISHEVRTPLNAMFGLAQVGARHAVGTPAARTFEQILESAQHLLMLVNDVLDFSKIEAGKLTLHEDQVDLAQVLEHVIALKSLRAQEKGLRLVLEESPELPQRCVGDATRIAQVLLNLISNAVKFTDQGEVCVQLDYDAPNLRLSVRDTGVGIAEADLPHLFHPFEQLHHQHAKVEGGTGLGLAITKRLVELMGGAIAVASTPGEGSTFTVCIPLHAPIPADFSPMQHVCLLALPNPVQTVSLVIALEARGCQVRVCERLPEHPEPQAWVIVTAPHILSDIPAAQWQARLAKGDQILVAAQAASAIQLPDAIDKSVGIISGPLSPLRLLNALHISPARRAASPPVQRLQGIRVLAAEDNPVNRLVLGQMLEQEGAIVTFAFDGALALEVIHAHGPQAFDIVLCDIQMPNLDGYQTTRALSHLAPGLPVIGLTAHAFDTARQQAEAVGMVDYITKPYLLDTLVEAIQRHALKSVSIEPSSASAPFAPRPPATMRAPVEACPELLPADQDWQAMQAHFGGQPQLLQRLLGMLGGTLSPIAIELRTALQTRDMDALAKTAHNIKGTALNLHTPELIRLAVQAQDQARQRQPEAWDSGEQLAAHLGEFLHKALTPVETAAPPQ